jgi:hypothetical protein
VPAEVYQTGTAADNEIVLTAPADEATPEGDPVGGTTAGLDTANIAFANPRWEGLDLVFDLEIVPAGSRGAPDVDLGPLEATVTSGQVVAYDAKDRPVFPQPVTFPSVNVSGTVAEPWETGKPAEYWLYPYPPVDWVFSAEFRVTFQESDFPNEGYYEMPLSITSTSGGFDDVFALNTLTARFIAPLVPFIAVVNSNNAMDDNFMLYLAGTQLGPLDFSYDGEFTTYIFVWSDQQEDRDAAAAAVASFFSINVSQLVVRANTSVAGPVPIRGDTYEVTMVNTKANNNGNQGSVVAGYIRLPGTIDDATYNPDDGANWTGTITWANP